MRPLPCIVLCWIWTAHLAGSFFIPNKRIIRTRGKESQSSFSDILGKMNELMNFAISVTKTSRRPKADVVEKKVTGIVCPSYKCSDKIEPGCRKSVYYVIQGQRCMGCDVDICKVERRRENARMPFKRSNINEDGAIEQRISVNPFNFENRWAFSRNGREQFDRSNSLQSVLADSAADRLPPGSENSWITGSMF
ncbi:uncharacterized protein LOC125646517 [Ostrea edulis]|uniref:uncharacterized protein LOC125646517 n=1 Tax=Ostrea edulis TaxID=37623 RepID=UPI0024AF7D86|nr:uncharacterized protein LOC125646517 [Ostrea edulis]